MSNPTVPLTLEGAGVLHQVFHFAWEPWRALDAHSRLSITNEAQQWLETQEGAEGGEQTAAYALLGHKGDLMLIHYRRDFVELLEAQQQLKQLRLAEFMDQSTSYLSVVELGLYESTRKIYEELGSRGLSPDSEAWSAALNEALDRQRKAMAVRLYPEIPESRYLCFYPMDRRRGERANWYQAPFADRQRMMQDHGMIGRRYAGLVKQVISGSIGLDDWEWGVDLWAESPTLFKQLIYEMRFDEVSAVYADFGPFLLGLRVPSERLAQFLRGEGRSAVE
jgi:chlorite dismutase